MTFLSLSARLLINLEALNMVESVGNVSRHRRATIILPLDNDYRKFEVPSISGESLAHGYQQALVNVAEALYGDSTPICKWCKMGEFYKHMDSSHSVVKAPKGSESENLFRFERDVISHCLAEDIGGFLRAEDPPVKRTSRFQVGYMVPAYDAIEASSLESQFHVRHAPSEPSKKGKEGEREAQMLYYVETGSAVYTLSFNLDVNGIGRTSMVKIEDAVDAEERKNRIKVALGALLLLLEGEFGAKRSRFLPVEKVMSLVVSVSNPLPFTVVPGITKDFITETLVKKERFISMMNKIGLNEDVKIFAFSKEIKVPEAADSAHEALERAIEEVMRKFG
jgi:CRISPR-associated protein Csa2